MIDPKSILITGAAGGIGSALARAYSTRDVDLFLGDVDEEGLERLCSTCRGLGAAVHAGLVDVREQMPMEDWVSQADSVRPLDLVIANAGISRGNLVKEETAEQIRSVFAVNLDGMLNTILPILGVFRQRHRGQIALMSSLAGIWGFPHAPSYSATKAAIRVFGHGLRARVKREGVSVSVVIPAFVETPMTKKNLYRMPGIIEADRAARIIKRKLARDKAEFVFPHPYPSIAWAISLVPPSLLARLAELR